MKPAAFGLTLALLCACAAPATRPAPAPSLAAIAASHPGSFYSTPHLGLGVTAAAGGLVVAQVEPGSAAQKAGFLPGDQVVSFGGMALDSTIKFKKAVNFGCNPGDPVAIRWIRAGAPMEATVVMGQSFALRDEWEVTRSLVDGNPVRLALLPGEITNVMANQLGAENFSQWQKTIQMELTAQFETEFLSVTTPYPDSLVIDRQHVKEALGELKFQNSGMVADESNLRLGRLIGATHLIIFDYSRTRDAQGRNVDHCYRRLIEVETGRVVASLEVPFR